MRVWKALLALTIVDTAWLASRGWSIAPDGLLATAVGIGCFMPPLAIKRYREDANVASTLRAIIQLIICAHVASIFTYLFAANQMPLIDQQLADVDHWLLLDWHALADWLAASPRVNQLMVTAYYSFIPQIAFAAIYLGLSGRHRSLEQFVWFFLTLLVIVSVISGLLPAAGYKPPSHFMLLREGRLSSIDFANVQGLISMPSMHAATAVLLAYAMRGTRLRFAVLAFNLLMIASTPFEGGHYFIDVIAGVALAVIVIAASRPLPITIHRPAARLVRRGPAVTG